MSIFSALRGKSGTAPAPGQGRPGSARQGPKTCVPTHFRNRLRAWRIRRDIRRAVGLLLRIDHYMVSAGWAQWRRQQFWRDFIKSPRARNILYRELAGPLFLKGLKSKPGGKE